MYLKTQKYNMFYYVSGLPGMVVGVKKICDFGSSSISAFRHSECGFMSWL
jgi:hypothetical protein